MNVEDIKTLQELTTYIIEKSHPDTVKNIKAISTCDEFMGRAHHGYGTALRNELGLWKEESHLYNFFKNTYGLTHADDMSGILLEKLYRVVHDDFDDSWISVQVERYRKHWQQTGNSDCVLEVTLDKNGKVTGIKKGDENGE